MPAHAASGGEYDDGSHQHHHHHHGEGEQHQQQHASSASSPLLASQMSSSQSQANASNNLVDLHSIPTLSTNSYQEIKHSTMWIGNDDGR